MDAKARFLKAAFVPLLKSIPINTPPCWGKMTVQHMTEHFAEAVRIASGKLPDLPLFTPAEHLPRMQAFLRSDKPMQENIRNPLLPDEPAPVRHTTMQAALDDLQSEIDNFFDVFRQNETATTKNPFFGDLDFELNIHLLYKHAQHHLRQFGVAVPEASG